MARSRASDWKPELKAGWPQQVLGLREGKLHALLPQHLYHSLANLGIELVHEAGYEDGGSRPWVLACRVPIIVRCLGGLTILCPALIPFLWTFDPT